jgi:hypothetical protein
MTKLTIIHLLFFGSALTASAHGGDEPGPHGGFIQMPANFHTEVISNKDASFSVYLLDMEFKNPLTKNSDVKAWVTLNKKKTDLVCKPEPDHFVCKGSKSLNTGTLFVRATRDGSVAAMDASYELPLKRGHQ